MAAFSRKICVDYFYLNFYRRVKMLSDHSLFLPLTRTDINNGFAFIFVQNKLIFFLQKKNNQISTAKELNTLAIPKFSNF